MGDFNFNLLKCQQGPPQVFINTLLSHSFYPLITKPTRVTSRSISCIDNIFSNIVNKTSTNGIFLFDTSDHFPVFHISELMISTRKKVWFDKRDLSHEKLLNFVSILNSFDWCNIFKITDANVAYDYFLKCFLELYNKHLPVQRVFKKRKEPCHPWITKGIVKSINKKNNLHRR